MEVPVSAATVAPAPITPAIRATPGRPHAPSYDLHGKLDPEIRIQIADAYSIFLFDDFERAKQQINDNPGSLYFLP